MEVRGFKNGSKAGCLNKTSLVRAGHNLKGEMRIRIEEGVQKLIVVEKNWVEEKRSLLTGVRALSRNAFMCCVLLYRQCSYCS